MLERSTELAEVAAGVARDLDSIRQRAIFLSILSEDEEENYLGRRRVELSITTLYELAREIERGVLDGADVTRPALLLAYSIREALHHVRDCVADSFGGTAAGFWPDDLCETTADMAGDLRARVER